MQVVSECGCKIIEMNHAQVSMLRLSTAAMIPHIETLRRVLLDLWVAEGVAEAVPDAVADCAVGESEESMV